MGLIPHVRVQYSDSRTEKPMTMTMTMTMTMRRRRRRRRRTMMIKKPRSPIKPSCEKEYLFDRLALQKYSRSFIITSRIPVTSGGDVEVLS